MSHPDILAMVAAAKGVASKVELITNGILLTPPMSSEFIRMGLDRIWVSIDGATPESYTDVRLGAELPRILENLEALRSLKYQVASANPRQGPGLARPRLGIAFVAMKRNLQDLPKVIDLGKSLGADTFSFSNVLAHTPQMLEEALYQSVPGGNEAVTEWSPQLLFPKMELSDQTEPILVESLKKGGSIMVANQDMKLGANRCPFAEKGSLSVRWDGAVSPCLALLHDHENLLGIRKRKSIAHSMGNVNQAGSAGDLGRPGLRRPARTRPGIRFFVLYRVQQLQPGRHEPGRLFRQHRADLRGMSVGPGLDPVPMMHGGMNLMNKCLADDVV